jgi:transposase InsO family protein
MTMQGKLTVERMCQMAQVSRAGFYRFLQEEAPAEKELAERAAVQEVAILNRGRYGYRRVTKAVNQGGLKINHKRVLRYLREDNLLALRHKAFVATTDSDHEMEVFFNLAWRMEVTAANQLWVADITYIRLRHEFIYLAVILDAFSRSVVGWALERRLHTRIALTALEMALARRQPLPGLVHHSDRGVQYASREYVERLQRHHIVPSMSRAANPYDNAMCESFMKTLKQEEIYCNRYRDAAELRTHIEEFIEQYYNRQRLHSALHYQSPEQFEAASRAQPAGATVSPAARVKMSFPRHEEIYQSDLPGEAGATSEAPPAHRLDESPADYSLASCSPAELASASSTDSDSGGKA